MNAFPSIHEAAGFPLDDPHPRAIEMAETMRELRGASGCATHDDLVAAGFRPAEIAAHIETAARLAVESFVRQARPEGDRIQGILIKAIAAAANAMPLTAGTDATEPMLTAWGQFCAARCAWKIDPWISQQERCLTLLDAFLHKLPLLPRERNRVVYALACHMKAHRHG